MLSLPTVAHFKRKVFTCANGQQISMNEFCDEIAQCEDESDENVTLIKNQNFLR